MLDSVLFAIHISKHSSIGTSPYRMLYNKDPILPFEYADQNDNLIHEHENGTTTGMNESDTSTIDSQASPITILIDKMETQRAQLFDKAKIKIQKSQQHQAKWYNLRNGAGEPFEIGTKVLCKNMKQLGCKVKMFKWFTGPYIVIGRCSTGTVYLKDRFSHQLSHPIMPNQLIQFNEHTKYKLNNNGDICNVGLSDEACSSESEISEHEKEMMNELTCQRSNQFESNMPNEFGPKTSTPVKSQQIIIMSSQEQPVSSDESVTIDVVNENHNKVTNLHDIPLSEMSIEIVDELGDVIDPVLPVVLFNPLTDEDR